MAKTKKPGEDESDIVKTLNGQFQLMVVQSAKQRVHMKNDHEMYYSDVDGTRTQFTEEQLDFIKQRYDIPISTKISWAIIETLIANITGGKPAPRLLASAPVNKEFVDMYQKASVAGWYECHGNRELTQAVRDCLAGGWGYMMVRPNDFYQESTFGAIIEYVPWEKVYVDPHSRKVDFSDAEYMCIVDVMPRQKADRKYDVTITDADVSDFSPETQWGLNSTITPIVSGFPYSIEGKDKRNRYVWVREFFSKQEVNVYIAETGAVSSKKPKPIQIPNPDKGALAEQIAQMKMQAEQMVQEAKASSAAVDQSQAAVAEPGTNLAQGAAAMQGTQRNWEETKAQMDQVTAQIMEAEVAYAQMPDMIGAYEMETIAGQTVQALNYFRKNQKMVKRWLLINNRIIEENIIPCDEYPIVSMTISVANRPDRVYGIMHYIKDIVKALNKFWSLLIYDMQTSAHRKVLYAKGSISDPAKAEKQWSQPNAFMEWDPIPDLPDGGRPIITEPSALNPAIERILGMLQQLLEYITGISSLMQGQPTSGTPDSFGGIQTMQSFGTQRVKMYSRWLEDSMERLVYVYICYLQAYAPKDKVLTYLDENGDQQEIKILESTEDLRFKVRINMTSAMPTARAMAAQLLGVLGGQTKDPHIQQLLTQYMVDYLDLPESTKIREEVDAVKNLSAELEQIKGEIEKVNGENRQLQQQIMQKNLEADYAKKKAELEAQATIASNQIDKGQTPVMPEDPAMGAAIQGTVEDENEPTPF